MIWDDLGWFGMIWDDLGWFVEGRLPALGSDFPTKIFGTSDFYLSAVKIHNHIGKTKKIFSPHIQMENNLR